MSRIHLAANATFWTAACVTFVGCEEAPSHSQSAQVSPSDDVRQADVAVDDGSRGKTLVTCRATLTAIEKDHPWFSDSSAGHDDGIALLASFVVVEPAAYANRAVGILFKYSAGTATPSPPGEEDIGSEFAFGIPKDFLDGNDATIDNANVEGYVKARP